MCVCVTHVLLVVSLLSVTSIRASGPARIYWSGAGHHFQSVIFYALFLKST